MKTPPRKIHPREERVRQAEAELRHTIHAVMEQHDLSLGEAIRVVSTTLGDWLGSMAKHMIRDERHPGEPDKPGGLA